MTLKKRAVRPEEVKIGIIICDRYRMCGGGKCMRALEKREGAFSLYGGRAPKIVGYSTCGGCPGPNIEHVSGEMKRNGAEVIHFATGFVVGYPPCSFLDSFREFIETGHGLKVTVGTHPIPQKYYLEHRKLGTWDSSKWRKTIRHVLTQEKIRLEYD